MYNTLMHIKLTKEDVLKKISEYDIFVKYMGFKPVLGNLYSSPLREDKDPSFGLFKSNKTGSILFKDLGTGECGDCFKLACLLEHKTPKEIYGDLINDNSQKLIKKSQGPIPVKQYDSIDIVVDDIPFTVEGLAFWNDFGITEDTLNLYNVKQIKRFWSNGFEYWTSSKSKPMFSYFVYDKVKIYRPFYKRLRFYSNCTNIDIQGLQQLDYTKDTVFITKSMKDLMLLHELGYTAVAPNGEGHTIPDKLLSHLRKKFKKVIILYDRDLPGLKAAKKLWGSNRDFDFMFTPRQTEKDLSDYYKRFGKSKTLQLISDHVKNDDKTND